MVEEIAEAVGAGANVIEELPDDSVVIDCEGDRSLIYDNNEALSVPSTNTTGTDNAAVVGPTSISKRQLKRQIKWELTKTRRLDKKRLRKEAIKELKMTRRRDDTSANGNSAINTDTPHTTTATAATTTNTATTTDTATTTNTGAIATATSDTTADAGASATDITTASGSSNMAAGAGGGGSTVANGTSTPEVPAGPSARDIEHKHKSRKRRREEQNQDFLCRAKGGRVVVLDCDFSDLQTQKELTSLSQQVMQCYGYNRRVEHPLYLVVAGISPGLAPFLDRLSGIDSWLAFERTTAPYHQALPSRPLQDFVYLTADSDNILEDLESDKVYVIGGIVDRNRHKGLTAGRALQHGVQTARLPLKENLVDAALNASTVLTVNQVFEMVSRYVECADWPTAIRGAVPKRKIVEKPN